MLQRLREGPAPVSELAAAAGVHENTARAHVAALEEGGLVQSESRPAAGPGRPGLQYRLTPDGERLEQDFLGLAELLAAVVGRTATGEQVRDIGREWGRYLVGRPGRYDIAERIPAVLRRLSFDAEVRDGHVVLTGCPCPVVSADRPELLCTLASGVLEGVLAAAGSPQRVGEEQHDPAQRRCRFTLVEVAGSRARRAADHPSRS